MEKQKDRLNQLSFISKCIWLATFIIALARPPRDQLEFWVYFTPAIVMLIVTLAYIRKITPHSVYVKDLRIGEIFEFIEGNYDSAYFVWNVVENGPFIRIDAECMCLHDPNGVDEIDIPTRVSNDDKVFLLTINDFKQRHGSHATAFAHPPKHIHPNVVALCKN